MVKELVEGSKEAIDGYVGKIALGLLLSILVWFAKTMYDTTESHTAHLATIEQAIIGVSDNVKDIKTNVAQKFTSIDASIGKVVDVESELQKEFGGLKAAEQQREIDAGKVAPRRFATP